MSTVIKAGEVGPVLKRLSTVDLADHLAEADSVIASARAQAAQLVRQAQQQAVDVLAQAKRAGYEVGHKEGRGVGYEVGFNEGREESLRQFGEEQAGVVSMVRQAIASFEEIKRDLTVTGERDLLEFAVSLAKKLTFAIGELYRESAQENLGRALSMVGAQTNLLIQANPKDLDAMKRFAGAVTKDVDESHTMRFVADSSIAPGGCRVESARTDIDMTLETQVDGVVALLLGQPESDE